MLGVKTMGRMFRMFSNENLNENLADLSTEFDEVGLGAFFSRLDTSQAISLLKQIPPHISALCFLDNLPLKNKGLLQILSSIPTTVTRLNLGYNNIGDKKEPSLTDIFSAIPRTVTTLRIPNLHPYPVDEYRVHLKLNPEGYNPDNPNENLQEAFGFLPPNLEEIALSTTSFHNTRLPDTLNSLPKNITTLTIERPSSCSIIEKSPTLVELIASTPENITTVKFNTVKSNFHNIDLASINELLDAVKALPIHITKLDWSGIEFDHRLKESIPQYIKTIPSSIKSLDLSTVFEDSIWKYSYLSAIPLTVTTLNLSQNRLDLSIVNEIPKHIETLDLRGNSAFHGLNIQDLNYYLPKSVTTVHTDSGTFGPAEFLKGRAIKTLDEQINKLTNKKAKLSDGLAKTTVDTLIETLTGFKEEYETDEKSIDDLKTDSIKAINDARPVLEVHRGWKEILGNIALAILGLGVGYIAACAYKGSFFKFKTDSVTILDDVAEQLNGVKPLK